MPISPKAQRDPSTRGAELNAHQSQSLPKIREYVEVMEQGPAGFSRVLAAPEGSHVTRGQRARLLLVDDDPLVLRSLVRLLKHRRPQLEVVAVSNALAALEQLKSRDFDVMVTDLQMPGVRGEELLEKAMSLYPKLTCVVHSNQVLFMPAELRARVRATISKPASVGEICLRLDDALERADLVRRGLGWL
jgi:CheY-like chemotaxis protein